MRFKHVALSAITVACVCSVWSKPAELYNKFKEAAEPVVSDQLYKAEQGIEVFYNFMSNRKDLITTETKIVTAARDLKHVWFKDGYGNRIIRDVPKGTTLNIIDSEEHDVYSMVRAELPNTVGYDGVPVSAYMDRKDISKADAPTEPVTDETAKAIFKTNTYHVPSADGEASYDVSQNAVVSPVKGSLVFAGTSRARMNVVAQNVTGPAKEVVMSVSPRELAPFTPEHAQYEKNPPKILPSEERKFEGRMLVTAGRLVKDQRHEREYPVEEGVIVTVTGHDRKTHVLTVTYPKDVRIPAGSVCNMYAENLSPMNPDKDHVLALTGKPGDPVYKNVSRRTVVRHGANAAATVK